MFERAVGELTGWWECWNKRYILESMMETRFFITSATSLIFVTVVLPDGIPVNSDNRFEPLWRGVLNINSNITLNITEKEYTSTIIHTLNQNTKSFGIRSKAILEAPLQLEKHSDMVSSISSWVALMCTLL